ncbi:putative histone-lysine N-methyltransferase 1 [Aphis craccivora]|uniref:Putative histone-lysine N-methyltransferase 1 n=1 Tax=Aphis craccivora TaxID=307492 RepID=A0A6G0ZJE0_APHCR|nr:putative histone-lysine N-methyltransferase 1 [Aphis craccivora]
MRYYQIKNDPASEPLGTDDKNNNLNEDVQDNTHIISSNADNPTENTDTDNNGNPNIDPSVLQGIFQRMSEKQINNQKSNDDEVNPEENDTPKTHSIEQQQPVPNKEDLLAADNYLNEMKLGLSSEPENEQNTDDEKTKKKKRKKKRKKKKNEEKLETADNEDGSKVSGADNIENQQPENSINDIELSSNPELITAMDVDVKEANDQSTLGEVKLEEANDQSTLGEVKLEEANDQSTLGEVKLEEANDQSTLGEVKLEEANDLQNTDGKKKKRRKKKRNKKKRNKKKQKLENIIEDIPTQDNMEINPMDIPVSPLEKVEIVKIKNNDTNTEINRKDKKKIIFEDYKPSDETIARIHCTFLGDVLKMYKKVKKHFVGHFCHSIIMGIPITLKHHQVPLSKKMKENMVNVHPVKKESLLIVIMQYSSYSDWAKALVNSDQLVINIIHTVDQYNIDGILFSNLQPIMGQDQIDNDMMTNLITFFEELTKKKESLKIGITIHMYSQWITSTDKFPENTEFTSFDQLNKLVTWYSYYTISMVKCSDAYPRGTSPLDGKDSFTNALDTIEKTKIDMSKLIVGIQLFPNKNNELEAYTYEEFCSAPKETWNDWCAAQPEDLRSKGIRLRDYSILGFQLFYMHSDDYRSTCGCYSFPLTRALLRGLLDIQDTEKCNFHTAHN